MPLKGNLKDFTAIQLLNLISLARKTGKLTLTKGNISAQLFFKDGRLLQARMSDIQNDLASIMEKAGRLAPQQITEIRNKIRSDSDRELGIKLIGSGLVGRDDVIQSIRTHMFDVANILFAWQEGNFLFEAELLPSADAIPIPTSLESAILDASRQLSEQQHLLEEFPDLNIALRLGEGAEAKLRHITLTPIEWRIISFINPSYSMKRIAQACNLDEIAIRKNIYALVQSGLVEKASLEKTQDRISRALSIRKKGPLLEKNVIERLISRIKGL